MKTVVCRWRLSSKRKAELIAEARREETSLSALLDRVTGESLARRRSRSQDEAEQAAIRKRALPAIGTISGSDPTRSARAGELVREIIRRKHVKESNALARRFGRRPR